MIPREQLEDYFNRSGDDELAHGNVETSKEHGFCIWNVVDDALVLIQVYGDGNYWNDWAEEQAWKLGKGRLMFATKRNPEGFERKYGYKVIGYILERDL